MRFDAETNKYHAESARDFDGWSVFAIVSRGDNLVEVYLHSGKTYMTVMSKREYVPQFPQVTINANSA